MSFTGLNHTEVFSNMVITTHTDVLSNIADIVDPVLGPATIPLGPTSLLPSLTNTSGFYTSVLLSNTSVLLSNGTSERAWLYAPFSPPGRILAICWCLFTSLLAMFGNTTVFLASVKYNALTVDKVSITLISNLAVVDFLSGVLTTLNLGYLVTGQNIYGNLICYLLTRIFFYLLSVGTVLIALLNLNKLHCLLYPMRVPNKTFRHGLLLCSLVWISIALIWLGTVVSRLAHTDTSTILFQIGGIQCSTSTAAHSKMVRVLTGIASVFFVVLPLLAIIVTSIWLACIVRRVTGALQRQGVFTMLLVSSVLFLSFLPYLCVTIMRDTLPEGQSSSVWFCVLFKVATLARNVNFAANPIIYCFTIRSFGFFVKSFISKWCEWSPLGLLRSLRVRLESGLVQLATVVGFSRNSSAGSAAAGHDLTSSANP